MGGGLKEPADGARGSVRTGDLGRALLDLEGAGETIEETLASIGQGQRPGERLRPGPADALGDSLGVVIAPQRQGVARCGDRLGYS